MKNISFIFPIKNEEKRLHNLKTFVKWCNKNIDRYEIILVSNGSKDKTNLIAKKFSKEYKYIKFYFTKYSSRGRAIKIGNEKSRFNLIAICSIDNAWEFEFYKKSYQLLKNKKFSIIYGPKDHSKSEIYRPMYRRIISFFCSLFLKTIFGGLITEDTQCIKMFKKDHAKAVNKLLSNSNFFSECEFHIIAKLLGKNSISIPVNVKDNKNKVDTFLIFKFIVEAIKFRLSDVFTLNKNKYLGS